VRVAQYIQGPLRAVAAFASAALLAVAASDSAEARIVKRLDYESGNFRQWVAKQARGGGAKIVKAPRRQGRYAARFRVRPGDNPIRASGERAEVWATTGERAGKTSWWKWSTRFPRRFRPGRNNWNVFTQWHNSGYACQPSASFVVDAHRRPFRLKLLVNAGSLNGCVASTRRSYSLGRLRRGRWQTFVFHVRWSPHRRGGFVEVWRNAKKVLGKKRIATLYYGQSVYVKQGYYRAPTRWTSVLFHDGLRRYDRRPPSLR
jgi:Polysaccharide lyase